MQTGSALREATKVHDDAEQAACALHNRRPNRSPRVKFPAFRRAS